MSSKLSRLMSQCVFIPPPSLTERNMPDQTGRICAITGGYVGVGYELAKMLYSKNATVYLAGRSADKAQQAIDKLKKEAPSSTGSLQFLHLDLADLSSIKTSAERLIATEAQLHVLWCNAGVMVPPAGSTGQQGHEMQMVTNCIGHWLFVKLLTPLLEKTAASSPPNTVRVCWAGSLAIDGMSPKGGVRFDESTQAPKVFKSQQTNYGQSKAGNLLMAAEYGQAHPSIVSVAFNPGNLTSDLWRHYSGFQVWFLNTFVLYKAIYGAYTELYCGLSPELTASDNGRYIAPWGRKSDVRQDIVIGLKTADQGGSGEADRFAAWLEAEVMTFA